MSTLKNFETHLKKEGKSEHSIRSYLYVAKFFQENYDFNVDSILEYKGYLVDRNKPKTVNLRIQALNTYLKFIGRQDLAIKAVKLQQKSFLEDVISHADYLFLKRKLKAESNYRWYFLVWFLGATGARVSELLKFKVEHVEMGYFDIYSKGGKFRRVFIPKRLRNECLKYLEKEERRSGYLFLNRYDELITARGISMQLKKYAENYGIDTDVVYPHSFRHMYAKKFLEKTGDIAMLADLMGHESIETTRIYLRLTASEQQAIIDRVVNW